MKTEYPKLHPLFSKEYSSDPADWKFNSDYSFGEELFYASGNNTNLMFFLGRLMCVGLAVILGLVIYLFSKEIYGPGAALFSLFLFSFSPTMIAHARLVCNDLPGALGITGAVYAFYLYRKEKSFAKLMILSVCLSAAFLTKFNSVLLFPMFFFYMAFKDKAKGIINFIIMSAVILTLINMFYIFDGTAGLKNIDYEVFKEMCPFEKLDRAMYMVYSYFPLPRFFHMSLTHLIFKNSLGGHSAYFMGMYSNTGWKLYFPVLFLLKTPVFTLFVVFLAAGIFINKNIKEGETILITLFIMYSLFAVSSKINIGHRHIILLYPIIFILAGRVFVEYEKKIMNRKMFKAGICTAYISSTLLYFPNYLSFFNCFMPPGCAPALYSDSNIDWGQDLHLLKKYLSKNGEPSLILSYFGTGAPEYYGINGMEILPLGRKRGSKEQINPVETEKEYFAISVTNLTGTYYNVHDIFRWLNTRTPLKKVGYSIYVYDISEDVEAAAILGNIYMMVRQPAHARRQYERVLYLSSDETVKKWAENKLAGLKQ